MCPDRIATRANGDDAVNGEPLFTRTCSIGLDAECGARDQLAPNRSGG